MRHKRRNAERPVEHDYEVLIPLSSTTSSKYQSNETIINPNS